MTFFKRNLINSGVTPPPWKLSKNNRVITNKYIEVMKKLAEYGYDISKNEYDFLGNRIK